MRIINKKNTVLILSITVLIIAGCEKTEDDQISQAQKCLDNATVAADAANCSAMISGINNEKANRIRCALEILANGTTQTEIINAFVSMETPTSESPVIELITVLGLGNIDSSSPLVDGAEVAIAESIRRTCYLTDSIGLKTVAELILFGTRAQRAADTLGDPENPNDVSNNIVLMSDQDAGEFGNDVFALYCVPTFSNQDICNTLASAGAGTASDASVGAALKACLQTNTCN